jgi:hypothetical protein
MNFQNINKIILELEQNGVIHLENVFKKDQIDIMQDIYNQSWNEIKLQCPTIWLSRKYKLHCKKYDNFIGSDLYNNKQTAYYKNTMIIDMQKNRYDFTYNLDTLKDMIYLPKIIENIMQKLLICEYDYYYGGLPIENVINNDKDIQNTNAEDINTGDLNGFWHRDAYSLFNKEHIDLELPPFYYTILIPLQYTDANNGGTEFILASHKINLSNMNINSNKKLLYWIETEKPKRYAPTLNVGDICIFNGYTIHRGLYNQLSNNRNMLYIVFKKNWYNDEPTENYIEQLN